MFFILYYLNLHYLNLTYIGLSLGLSLGCHLVVTWLSLGCHLVVTWLSSGCHLVVIWLPKRIFETCIIRNKYQYFYIF